MTEDEEAWNSELERLFGEFSEDEHDEAAASTASSKKRMERTPTKDIPRLKKKKEVHEEGEEQPSLMDVMASLSLMRQEILENRTENKRNMKKMCAVLHEDVKKVHAKVNNVEEALRSTKVKVVALEAFEVRMTSEMKAVKSSIEDLRTGAGEKTVFDSTGDSRNRCAVWGGLPGAYGEAVQWIKNELSQLDVPSVAPEFFVKGGEANFKNILFTKFESKQQRDDVIKKMRQRLEDGLEDAWVKPDLPVKVRAVNGFLLGLKHLMTSLEWGYNKSAVKVDLVF